MKIGNIRLLTLLLGLIAGTLINGVQAYNMRQTFSGNGLSNSAILALGLDDKGYLWIGTCDGVNIADGTTVHTFESLYPGQALSGSVIETIQRGDDGEMWVLTNHALDRVDSKSGLVTAFPQFHGQERLYVNSSGRLYVLSEESLLYVYEDNDPGVSGKGAEGSRQGEFKNLGGVDMSFTDVFSILMREGKLWVVGREGTQVYDISDPESATVTKPMLRTTYPIRIRFAEVQQDSILVITEEGELCEIDQNGETQKILDISHEVTSRGRISGIVRDHQGNYFVSFGTDGVLWVGKNEQKEYMSIDLGLHVGVFCLEPSLTQDVVWIGSDCQGVYTFWDDKYSIRSFDFNDFDNKISHPVRSIWIDEARNLWIGTKGDGLLKIPDVDQANPRSSLSKGRLYTSTNSELLHNFVYAFYPSVRSVLWIGTDSGVNYYDYGSGSIRKLIDDPTVKNIHGIYEENENVLWLSSVGYGAIRLSITWRGSLPVVENVKRFTLDGGRISSNAFFSLSVGEEGRLLFCNRGSGVYEIEGDSLKPIPLKNDFGSNIVKDVFEAIQEKDVLWLGTGDGLLKSAPDGEELFRGIEEGFANNTIHDMLRTHNGLLWISTNSGIVEFDPSKGKGVTYGHNYGLSVTEYSDGAAFYNGKGMIFGGINGVTFIWRHPTYVPSEPYSPMLNFVKLSVSGEGMPLVDYIHTEKGKQTLVLSPDENYFSLTVSVPDFIDAQNYVYSYTLDGINWINNGSETTISFNGMAYGTYTLTAKYMNRVTGIESEPCTLKIVVKAPWYLSGWAKLFYILLFVGLILLGVWFYIRRQREKQSEEMRRQEERQREEMRQLEQVHKENLYEEKLRFFTNITHEFCTPLTLIYGPCERISTYPGSDDYIKRYIGLVRSNAERLNTLIQELIDFRRMETGHKTLKITEVGVSALCSDIIVSFSELADRNNINLVEEIVPDIDWPTDFSCLRKILTNLVSNAFKYTPNGGTIKITVRKLDGEEKLYISVYNTGKGITPEEKKKIFNRYSVLDNVEENAVKGLSARNGLGLAICHSMVDMLKGKIEVESEPGKYAEFIVELPALELQTDSQAASPISEGRGALPICVEDTATADMLPGQFPSSDVSTGKKERILVVDDNTEILTLLRDTLSAYDVVVAESADRALEILKQTPPELIVSDIMMPGTDGMTFTRMVKQNKHTMHIPLVLLSAKTSNRERVEGLESGADAYIGKPFSLDYLQAVVRRLLDNRQYLREYYTTGASAFEYSEGQLLHKDDKDFMAQIVAYIEEHIADEDLGPEKLATHMKISVRNLYRRFKELDQLSPNDFIKYQRVSYAGRLLLTSSATVQEVIYRSGFTNRSHFYKEFDKRFGMTPKNYRTANVAKDRSLDTDDED